MHYASYAIWWVPRTGTALARFGAEWTGWCADRGIVTATPVPGAVISRPGGVPGSVGRFGLHGTIKSAFCLVPGRSRWALEDALADLAERTAPIRLPPFELTVFDGRVVLAPSRPEPALTGLLATVARAISGFHVPPSHAPQKALPHNSRRRQGWSAPALERFHLPLTDGLDLGTAYQVVASLQAPLARALSRRQSIADLALVGDPGEGRPWRLLQRYALWGEAMRPQSRVPAGMAWSGPCMLAPMQGAALM